MTHYLSTEAMAQRVAVAIPEIARRVSAGESRLSDLPSILANAVTRYLQTGRVDVGSLIF